MRTIPLRWAAALAVGLIVSVHAEGNAASVNPRAADENSVTLARSGGQYAQRQFRSCGYYRYVCRAWWTGCGWEGPYASPLNQYWGFRYICW